MMPNDPVVGGSILRRPAIRSPNYKEGASGWSINADGSAEFNSINTRDALTGIDYVINPNGIFFYGA